MWQDLVYDVILRPPDVQSIYILAHGFVPNKNEWLSY